MSEPRPKTDRGARAGGPAPAATLHHIEVTRRARFAALGSTGPHVREFWLACHGYGELASSFIGNLGALAAPHRLVVAPEALSRFYLGGDVGAHGPESRVGATWMTREDRLSEIHDYVDYLDALSQHVRRGVGAGASPRFVALGFSQGTATISRWAARTTAPPDELVLWGGGLPPELEPAALGERWKRTRVTMVIGTRDRWLREAQLVDAAAALAAHGIVTRVLSFEGGHRLDDETLLAVAAG